ncbi:diaminopimelate epimerase [Halorubellus sp. JP-L1]|uniref:diaminopimelate epimerase n=1 Tax=Halorubellus sp. JP-L1 TaxID=2715753 RepID=UPI00140CE5F6|nr:diaminopimelate epimerase [Halorubellus sp. JP-L1]NHN42630.1 diaminopimelate epimerase [Halorubellus sp. JP-L1]
MTGHGTVDYRKYNGTGNDFVVVDADEYVPDRAAFATRHCDRTDGVGADGVLFLALEARFDPPRVVMTLVQPDGSTAAMCGNGARVAAEWAMERTGADEVMIDTQAGTRHARRDGDEVSIEMGEPRFEPEVVPLSEAYDEPMLAEDLEGYAVTGVNTGVPHAVGFVEDVADVDIDEVAPPIRSHEAFPEGANVTFASRRDDGGFDQRTYERGVEGETASCGTGAVAIAAAARVHERIDDDVVRVSPPGGDLVVSFPENGAPTLTGPVVHEFDGEATASIERVEPKA